MALWDQTPVATGKCLSHGKVYSDFISQTFLVWLQTSSVTSPFPLPVSYLDDVLLRVSHH